MEQITKKQMDVLIENGILKNTREGIVTPDGMPTGFYQTRNKKYIEEKYVCIAKDLIVEKVL